MVKSCASSYHRLTSTNLLLRTLLVLIMLGWLGVKEADAQSRKRLRELEKTEERQQQEAEDKSAEAKKRHMDIQSKQTKREMKRYRKKSKRYNKNRRTPFWKKWFRRK